MANRVVVTICGEDYTFVAEESTAYTQKVAAYVNDKMEEVLKTTKVGRTDAAILTAANIADELFKAQEASEQLRGQIKGYLDEAGKAQAEVSELKREIFRLQQKLDRYEEGGFYCWGVSEKGDDSLIGLVELVRLDEVDNSCSFVYMLGCSYWNKGYGTEMLKAVFGFAFEELEVQRIAAEHMEKNVAAGAAMGKAGMKHIATEEGKYEKLGIRQDALIYEIRTQRQAMTVNDYQKKAMATLNPALSKKDVLINGVMGLCGESGEAIDIVKKWLAQGHDLDREKLAKELGDVAWYLAEAATALDMDLETILLGNLDKLAKRYPEGFQTQRSLNRTEE